MHDPFFQPSIGEMKMGTSRFKNMIKEMSISQLEKLKGELKTALINLNRQRNWTGLGGSSALQNSAQLKTTRKNIARIETRINELKKNDA